MGRPPVGIVIWENSAGDGESPAWSGFMTKLGLYARSEDWSLGDPGNSHSRAASGTPCDFRRSACLFPPQAAAGSGPRLGAWGDRSRARPVGPKPSAPSGRRSEAERRELQGAPPAVRLCRLPGSMKRGETSETERSVCATIPFPGLKSPIVPIRSQNESRSGAKRLLRLRQRRLKPPLIHTSPLEMHKKRSSPAFCGRRAFFFAFWQKCPYSSSICSRP